MKASARFLVLLALAACTGIPNEEAFRYKLNNWIGHDVNDVIVAWGPPSKTYGAPNGNTIYTYKRGEPLADTCVVDLTVGPAKKVTGWRYSGTTCATTY
ncbi:MAG TPA: hypothetical protein VEG36_04245 [Burkholderiales bacterium]|nr:hypothetical protein [Burkholderiales bacterium]